MDEQLRARVTAWIVADPDPQTTDELRALLADGDGEALHDRFQARLAFGTAGIRGPVGAGPARMNLAVVRQTAWGLARVLIDSGVEGPVIVGNDARPDSPRFAADLAGVLAAEGLAVEAFGEPVPTPLVAWWARRRAAAAAVVVTASHNPREDNGIKVYDARGIQIIPPTDQLIADAIERAPAAVELVPATDLVTILDRDAIEHGYREAMRSRLRADVERATVLSVATALHGVGAQPLERLLSDAGHRVEHVAEQREPDGTFPTVPFPNPEEPGALDLALALAAERGADLVLANDPDADRLAVALPDGRGGHRPLTGNEVGALLGDALLTDAGAHARGAVVASSIVSSPQLAAIADLYGAEHRTTLTGFKWIWTALLDAENNGRLPLFGYEEALGYAVDAGVRDKDGLSAALAVVDLAAREAVVGRTLADRLDDVARRTGLWSSAQRSARFDGDEADSLMTAAMDGLRREPPRRLGTASVEGAMDYLVGAEDRPPWLGAQDLLAWQFRDEADANISGRILVRPSGTEPKLKVYVDVHLAEVDPTAPRAEQSALQSRAAALGDLVLTMALGETHAPG